MRRLIGLHYTFLNSKNRHSYRLNTVILSFVKILSFVNISENLQENQGPKVTFWKDCEFPFRRDFFPWNLSM